MSSATAATNARGRLAPKAWKRLRRKGLAVMAPVLVIAIVAVALLAPTITRHSPPAISYTAILRPPASTHWFDTDCGTCFPT